MPNYTITTFTSKETIGSSVFAGNMVSSGTMTITPRPNHVVFASDFSVSSLPNFVSSVSFSDTTTAGKIGNKVIVTINLDNSLTIAGNTNIILDIDGDARIYDSTLETSSFFLRIIEDSSINVNATSSISAESNFTKNTPTTSGSITTTKISGNLTINQLTKIGTISLTANTGFHFTSTLRIKCVNISDEDIIIKQASVTNSNNRATAYTYDLFLKSSVNIPDSNSASIIIYYKGKSTPVIKKEITQVDFGPSIISKDGELRPIKIIGNVGAEFNVAITNSSNVSVLTSKYANKKIVHPFSATLSVFNKQLYAVGNKVLSSCTIFQKFPAGADTYTMTIFPLSGTTLKTGVASTYTINQYVDPTITIVAIEGSGGPHYSITNTGRKNFTFRAGSDPRSLGVTKPYIFDINIVCDIPGSETFSITKTPTWSSTNQSNSDWTNSVAKDNGGTQIEIFDIAVALTNSNRTATITARAIVKQYGNANVIMNLDVDNILTAS